MKFKGIIIFALASRIFVYASIETCRLDKLSLDNKFLEKRCLTIVFSNDGETIVCSRLSVQRTIIDSFEVHQTRGWMDSKQLASLAVKSEDKVLIDTLVFVGSRNGNR